MDYSPLVPIAFVVIVGAVGLWVQHVLARKRREEWQRVASQLGLRMLDQGADPPLLDLLDRFMFGGTASIVETYPHPLLQRGHHRRAPNAMVGDVRGCHVMCFDYQYTVGSGKSSRTYYFLCLLVPSPIPFTPLEVTPEGLSDRIGSFLGMRDLQFESEDFNRRFKVTCEDPRFAFHILHPRAMEFLMQTSGITLQATGRDVLFYLSRTSEAEAGLLGNIKKLLATGPAFIELIPEYLATPDTRHSPARSDGGF